MTTGIIPLTHNKTMKQATIILLAAQLSVGWITTSSSSIVLVNAFVPTTSDPRTRYNPLRQQQLQIQQQSSSPRYVAVDRHFSHDIEDKHDSRSPRHHPSSLDHVQSLWVFVHNLQRERRERSPAAAAPRPSAPTSGSQSEASATNTQEKETRRRNPAKSLVNFLSKSKFSFVPDNDNTETMQAPKEVEPFSRAVVQAIRLASESGDYKLIIHLVEASVQYANQHPIIMPRVFGEAIDGISKTSANIAKIKQLWNLGTSDESKAFLTEPLGTFELNIMIKAIASRGKIRAALSLYQEYTQQSSSPQPAVANATEGADSSDSSTDPSHAPQQPPILPDPYTLSSIFSALQESIADDQLTKLQNSTQLGVETNGNIAAQSSQCWQWNDAMNIFTSYMSQESSKSNPPLNNHVFASLLKLNERVSEVYPPSAHNGPRMALYLLNTMHQLDISPDVVTCTLIISNLGYQWKTAVNLLYAMKTTPQSGTAAGVSWKLPRPNVYTYSAVITICAHCHQYQVAMELLQEMKQDDDTDSPNTWVYNAALLATTRSDSFVVLAAESSSTMTQHQQKQQSRAAPKQKRSQERLLMAMKLLSEMKEDADKSCRPDTVTYNTVLATLDGIASPSEPDEQSTLNEIEKQFALHVKHESENQTEEAFEERAVHSLMDEMESSSILRDSITYRNALLAVRFSSDIRDSVWRILDRAMLDKDALGLVGSPVDHGRRKPRSYQDTTTARQLGGKAADGVTFVFDTAMTILASRGDVEGVLLTFEKMMKQTTTSRAQIPFERFSAAQIHFLRALGRVSASGSALIPVFLNALKKDNIAKLAIRKEYPTMDELLFANSQDNEPLFSAAISSCLVANDIDNARKVLTMMKGEGLKPSESSLQEIARTYARLAVVAADEETKNTPPAGAGDQPTLAETRAKNAFSIATQALVDPPASLLSTIARTCASLGMWKEASSMLRMLHRIIPRETRDLSNIGSIGAAQTVLPGVHRALLRAASIQGNVTAALWYVEDIQELSRRLAKSTERQGGEEDELLPQPGDGSLLRTDPSPLVSTDISLERFGMAGEDWKLLMIAASKCGHWRVCLSTLQFLRPFLEETHPSSLGFTVEERSRRYGHLTPALTVAVKCLEIRSQYGWAVRAIDDWMEWSGRRPPKAAVLAAIRILSARGRGNEVLNLLARCTLDGGMALVSYPNTDENYEMVLYVGAITALHNEGLYDDADDAFVAAVNGRFLPFDLKSQVLDDGKQHIVLDLHGMNVPVAHSAVRVALQQEVETASWSTKQPLKRPSSSSSDGDDSSTLLWDDDMIIVTGRGRNSALRMRPVLRPEVQRMLLEEFYPPLCTTSIPGNMGAVRIPSTDIGAWLAHQRQQKGSRMLAVASVLRNVSSVDRIRNSIALRLQADEKGTNPSSDKKEEQNDEPQAE